jgi:hypothetical protein
MGRILDEDPEDLPRRNHGAVIPVVTPVDVYQPDEVALPSARNRKRASKELAGESAIQYVGVYKTM